MYAIHVPSPIHVPHRPHCPFLPRVEQALRPSDIRNLRRQGGSTGYLATLNCAQSLWLQALPAQALLQLNHALAIQLPADTKVFHDWPLPYQAKVWILKNHQPPEFIGNPVRHYQHLATRVSGPKKELRSWRAWACFHLAEQCLPSSDFPRDHRQIEKENLSIPLWDTVLRSLSSLGTQYELDYLKRI